MGAELDSLTEQYSELRGKEGVTQLELAQSEDAIWAQVTRECGRGRTSFEVGERRVWFATRFGGSITQYEIRSSIYNAGAWAHKLYTYIDQGTLRLTTCAQLLRKTKTLIRQQAAIPADALEQVLAEHAGQASQVDAPAGEAETPLGTASKTFHRQVILLADAFVRESFKDRHVDDYYLKKLVADFTDTVDMAIQELRNKINTVKRNTRDEGIQGVGPIKFKWACEVLGLTYKYKDVVDMRVVKRRKNDRALDLHPDRNKENAAAAEELGRVLTAYEILDRYNERNNRKLSDAPKADRQA